MKTKILVLILSLVAIVSFTALTSKKNNGNKSKEPQTYESTDGQTMTDKNQFD